MKNFSYYLDKTGEWGQVTEVVPPVVKVVGLPSAKLNELVIFEGEQLGQIMSLDPEIADVLLLSEKQVKVGDKAARLDSRLTIDVGPGLFGTIINPLGQPVLGGKKSEDLKEKRELETEIGGISTRSRVNKPFHTGVSVVDLVIPLGKGQKELILGDRKNGKTSFLLTTIKTQAAENTIVIYTIIGKRKTESRKLIDHLSSEKIPQRYIIVAASADDPIGFTYLAPYSAMTIAEYFRDQGEDVLVIFDDLTSHAKAYREISLIEGSFPGREAYPADIIYLHSRLLERAGCFKNEKTQTSSITCLPIAETIESDLTGFISTNLMGMTDGHIFFDSDLYYQGHRPAINIQLSVTRVGKQTQSKLKREINQELLAFMSLYERIKNYAHFGAELSEKVKKDLKKGEQFYAFFNQPYQQIVPEDLQIFIFALIWLDFFIKLENEKISDIRSELVTLYEKDTKFRNLLATMSKIETLYEFLSNISRSKNKFIDYAK